MTREDLVEGARAHLTGMLIPFWEKLRDEEYGGFYGYMDYDLRVDRKAVKGCILNSRICWFFSRAYCELREPQLLEDARHAFAFMRARCFDGENG